MKFALKSTFGVQVIIEGFEEDVSDHDGWYLSNHKDDKISQ